MEQELDTLPEHPSSTTVLVGIVLLNLLFSVYTCIFVCAFFYFDHCLSFFDLRFICYYPFGIFKLCLNISLMWFFNNNKRIVISSIWQAKISNPQRTSVNLTWKERQWAIPQIRYESAYRWKGQNNRDRIHSLSCIGLVWQKQIPNIFAKKMKSTEQSKTLISYKFKFEGVEFLYYYDVIAVIKVLPE